VSSRRLPQTLADYMVVGISPALIALLVGSLVFFLAEVFYHGQFYHRLIWVLACFVVAAVGIARISMEEGTAYAALFGIPLAIAVGLAMLQFVQIEGPLAQFGAAINLGLMVVVWWCAHKLTWDCTLVDDSQDASGQGLLQTLGWENEAAASSAIAGDVDGTSSAEPAAKSWWQHWAEPDKRPHAPGMWVIYFSLAALPLFGLGQWFIPVEDVASRRYVFWLLVVYSASALGLLLTTSFLGLRRYLRQRQLEMPANMAGVWLGLGAALIVALLVVVSLLPRPSPEYSIAQLAPHFTSPERDASDFGMGDEGGHEADNSSASAESGQEENPSHSGENGEQSSGEQSSSQAKQSDGQGSKGESSGGKGDAQTKGKKSGGKKTGDAEKSKPSGQQGSEQDQSQSSGGERQRQGEQSASTKNESRQSEDEQRDGNSAQSQAANASSTPPPSSFSLTQMLSSLSPWLGTLFKWICFAAVLIVLLVVGWKYRDDVLAALQKFLAELREFWARLFGGKRPEAAAAELVAAPIASPPSFASFADPFTSGLAARVSLAELVRYSFAALEAWGREQRLPRVAGQTPHEYAQQLAQAAPTVSTEARQLAEIYGQLAYSQGSVPKNSVEHVRRLWNKLQAGSSSN
jgi:hypothetical protein